MWLMGPGITDQSGTGLGIRNWPFLTPGYSLATSMKTYDSTIGDVTTTTNFGSAPEMGQAVSNTLDPTGLNYTSSSTYETQGATGSLMRQTSKTLPGGDASHPTTTYAYYTATETRDNPCTTTTTEAYKQGGMLKTKTEADSDGSGTQTARSTETIYDDAGRVVATRYNADSWTCSAYDNRGRNAETVIPAHGNEPARTVANDYAVGGNPLVTTTWDNNGWIVVWNDLLGRTVKYRDVHDDETTTTYDALGRMSQRSGPLGAEVFEYDNYNRLTDQKLDGTIVATSYYDSYGRLSSVDYPTAGNQKLYSIDRDVFGSTSRLYYKLGDGSEITDEVTRSQSGQILTKIQWDTASGSA